MYCTVAAEIQQLWRLCPRMNPSKKPSEIPLESLFFLLSLWSRLPAAPLLPQNTHTSSFCQQNRLERNKPLDILASLQLKCFWNSIQSEHGVKRSGTVWMPWESRERSLRGKQKNASIDTLSTCIHIVHCSLPFLQWKPTQSWSCHDSTAGNVFSRQVSIWNENEQSLCPGLPSSTSQHSNQPPASPGCHWTALLLVSSQMKDTNLHPLEETHTVQPPRHPLRFSLQVTLASSLILREIWWDCNQARVDLSTPGKGKPEENLTWQIHLP